MAILRALGTIIARYNNRVICLMPGIFNKQPNCIHSELPLRTQI